MLPRRRRSAAPHRLATRWGTCSAYTARSCHPPRASALIWGTAAAALATQRLAAPGEARRQLAVAVALRPVPPLHPGAAPSQPPRLVLPPRAPRVRRRVTPLPTTPSGCARRRPHHHRRRVVGRPQPQRRCAGLPLPAPPPAAPPPRRVHWLRTSLASQRARASSSLCARRTVCHNCVRPSIWRWPWTCASVVPTYRCNRITLVL